VKVEPVTFPEGLNNAFFFATFNALSFQVVVSSPMVLYAKSLGASATVLGIVAGMMPLLVIFQIPAARYVSRVGYKRFVYAGWGMRVMFIFGMALVPITHVFLNPTSRLALILLLLFAFNLSRGISSCAWLPWITSLVPAPIRGKYLTRDAGCVNVASFGCFLLGASCLAGNPQPWQFAVLFGFSACMGAASLVFLKRIPDVETPAEERSSTIAVPWGELLRYEPFRKLLRMVIAWSIAYGGMTAFTVAFLKTEVGMSEAKILLVSSVSFLGGLSTLWVLGTHLDSFGSKPVLTFSFVSWLVVLGGWALLAGRMILPRMSVILALEFFMGLLAALVPMSNTRLAMVIVPAMGRNHFFAIFSVIGNLCLGLAPIFWGLVIDAVGGWRGVWLGLEWNRFSLFFGAVGVVMCISLALSRRLHEPEAASFERLVREVLVDSPQRALGRLFLRG
jgi:MFS family permease